MALAALIGAYQEDDRGGLRALLPLAGRTLFDYQARVLAGVGAAPIVALVERIPPALNEAFERLAGEGITIIAVSDPAEAASRFEAGSDVLLLADGVAPDVTDVLAIAGDRGPAILTVADDELHAGFERIDGGRRWGGLARLESGLVGATAAMLGDWDLQSTLLRRAIQAGVPLRPVAEGSAGPLLAEGPEALQGFERQLILASRGGRDDATALYLLPMIEDVAVERLMETRVTPAALSWSAVGLTLAAALCFTRSLVVAAMVMLSLSLPLDLIARRLALLRLRPVPAKDLARRLLWPASGLALLAAGMFAARHGSGWGAIVAALAAAAFAEASRIEAIGATIPGKPWLVSRRNAIVAALPFAAAEAWPAYLALLALGSAAGFFYIQHVQHLDSDAPR
ncbi:hypothetical protein ABDK56_00985 [Sphingomonas sp. ASV193]|uniref:hypothetical protein n=1 Tax=Sphingomonas sp. ASV193 TaxID=3144405 RepID=UPI0032E8A2E4